MGGIVQLVERVLCKHKVIGSSPIISKMKYLLVKDKRRRILFDSFEKRRKVLLALYQDLRLSDRTRLQAYSLLVTMPRDSSITRLRTRCTLTNRPRAVYRHFGLSRLMFRKLAWQGKLMGVKKASW